MSRAVGECHVLFTQAKGQVKKLLPESFSCTLTDAHLTSEHPQSFPKINICRNEQRISDIHIKHGARLVLVNIRTSSTDIISGKVHVRGVLVSKIWLKVHNVRRLCTRSVLDCIQVLHMVVMQTRMCVPDRSLCQQQQQHAAG